MRIDPGRKRSDQRGFTLIELLVSMMILGILAGIAVPKLRKATFKAHAAHVVADAHTVHLAAAEFLTENGRYPGASGWGAVPPDLVEYLPDGYDFEYEGGVRYLWASATFPNQQNLWGARNLGLFAVNYASLPQLADALKSHQGRNTLWAGNILIFLYPG